MTQLMRWELRGEPGPGPLARPREFWWHLAVVYSSPKVLMRRVRAGSSSGLSAAAALAQGRQEQPDAIKNLTG